VLVFVLCVFSMLFRSAFPQACGAFSLLPAIARLRCSFQALLGEPRLSPAALLICSGFGKRPESTFGFRPPPRTVVSLPSPSRPPFFFERSTVATAFVLAP